VHSRLCVGPEDRGQTHRQRGKGVAVFHIIGAVTENKSQEFVFGDTIVIIDRMEKANRISTVEYIWRVRRNGKTACYFVDAHPEDVKGMSDRHVAEWLLRHARHKSRMFTYRGDDE